VHALKALRTAVQQHSCPVGKRLSAPGRKRPYPDVPWQLLALQGVPQSSLRPEARVRQKE